MACNSYKCDSVCDSICRCINFMSSDGSVKVRKKGCMVDITNKSVSSGVLSVNGKTGNVVLTTSDINEGSRMYFTNTRARAALSAGDGIHYDDSTGVISLDSWEWNTLDVDGSSIQHPTFSGTISPIIFLNGQAMDWQDLGVVKVGDTLNFSASPLDYVRGRLIYQYKS